MKIVREKYWLIDVNSLAMMSHVVLRTSGLVVSKIVKLFFTKNIYGQHLYKPEVDTDTWLQWDLHKLKFLN